MKNVYKKHNFKCPKCGLKQVHGAWTKDIAVENFAVPCTRPKCPGMLSAENIVKSKAVPKAPGIRTPTKNRV